MKRPPATENSDCVLSHLLERSPLMRESAAQCYNHRLAYNLGKNATVGSTVVCKHLRTSGIGCSLRENLGGAAIICGASQSNNSLSCSQTDRYSFFSDADAYSRIPFCLYKQWGSDRLGNIGGLPESEGPPSINWPDLVQIKPQSSTVRHRAG